MDTFCLTLTPTPGGFGGEDFNLNQAGMSGNWREINKSSSQELPQMMILSPLVTAGDLLGQQPGNNLEKETSAGIFSFPEPVPSDGKPVVCGFGGSVDCLRLPEDFAYRRKMRVVEMVALRNSTFLFLRCQSDGRLCFRLLFVVSRVSAGAAESAHQTNTGRCSVSPPDGGTGHGQREHAETCGARARRGRGRGRPVQPKHEPRSVLKSNLILQFKDPTKLFSRKRREAQKPWR